MNYPVALLKSRTHPRIHAMVLFSLASAYPFYIQTWVYYPHPPSTTTINVSSSLIVCRSWLTAGQQHSVYLGTSIALRATTSPLRTPSLAALPAPLYVLLTASCGTQTLTIYTSRRPNDFTPSRTHCSERRVDRGALRLYVRPGNDPHVVIIAVSPVLPKARPCVVATRDCAACALRGDGTHDYGAYPPRSRDVL